LLTADDINPYPIVTNEAREAFKKRLAGARNMGLFTPIGLVDTVHLPGANGGALFGYTAAEPTGQVYVIGLNDPGVLKLVRPTQTAPGSSPGQTAYVRECQTCHGPDRSGTATGPTLLTLAERVDTATIRSTIAAGKGRMPAFPHINDVDMDALVAYLSAPPPGGGRGRGRGAGPAPTFPAGPVVASGGAQVRPSGGGRGRGPRPYPEGVEQSTQYVIDSYGMIGTMMKPPFASLTKYDLNTGTIAWQVGLGDHAKLAALGITGTGTTQMRSSMVVTAAGLLFAPGGDSKVRAFDTDSGKVVWTAALGGAIRGAPSMYEIDGRQYLLVSASGEITDAGLPPGGAAPSHLPKGYVAFALSKK
jgi:quinoprotein glucose dehydrogenase